LPRPENEQRAELLEIPRGEQGALADPTGSDMWRAEVVGEESASITPPLDGETGLLIASNGIEGAPRSLSITWDLTDQPVTIAPITLIGISLMVIGAVMALIEAIIYRRKYRRRRIGPRQDLLAAALLEEQSVRLVLHAEVEERRHYLLQQAF